MDEKDIMANEAPCGCPRVVDDGMSMVGHTDDCRAKRMKANEKALAADAQAHLDKQEVAQMMADLKPMELRKLLGRK